MKNHFKWKILPYEKLLNFLDAFHNSSVPNLLTCRIRYSLNCCFPFLPWICWVIYRYNFSTFIVPFSKIIGITNLKGLRIYQQSLGMCCIENTVSETIFTEKLEGENTPRSLTKLSNTYIKILSLLVQSMATRSCFVFSSVNYLEILFFSRLSQKF